MIHAYYLNAQQETTVKTISLVESNKRKFISVEQQEILETTKAVL